MKLFGHPYSHNSRKVHWALAEIGADFDYELVDLMTGAHKAPAFVAKNPNGRVPVLEDGDVRIFESNAILLYLADRFPESPLGLADPGRRALVAQWVLWQASDLASAILAPWLMTFYASMGQPLDEAEHARLVEAAQPVVALLEQHLAAGDGLVGGFSIADIAVAESIGLCEDAGISLQDSPATSAWYGTMAARPAFEASRPQG